MMRWDRISIAACCALALAGCAVGNSRKSLGIDPPAPDEFMVVARAPLQMPADLGALPTPQPGAPSPVIPQPVRDARAALGATGEAAAPSAAEQALLAQTGANAADPAIRDQLAAEKPAPQRRYGLTSLFGVKIEQDPRSAEGKLDAAAEAERLRNAGVRAPVAPPKPTPPGPKPAN